MPWGRSITRCAMTFWRRMPDGSPPRSAATYSGPSWSSTAPAISTHAAPPTLVFDLKDRADLAAMATSLPPLVKLGVPVPVNWVQEQLGIPLPAKGEADPGRSGRRRHRPTDRRPGPRIAALAQVIGPRYRDQEALDQVLQSRPAGPGHAKPGR
ncbi:phage portal protein family protein [Pseudomonas aeruginosa]